LGDTEIHVLSGAEVAALAVAAQTKRGFGQQANIDDIVNVGSLGAMGRLRFEHRPSCAACLVVFSSHQVIPSGGLRRGCIHRADRQVRPMISCAGLLGAD
jgi:hypothetical protein